jgi:hypothetical protein
MRIPFRLLTIACFFVFIFNSNFSIAQIKFGPKAGLSFSELPNNTKYIIGKQQLYGGYHIGVIAEYRLFEKLFLQPGLLITTKGSKYIVGNDTAGIATGFSDFEFSAIYVDIPLNLVYKFDMGPCKLLLITGPQIGFGIRGRWSASYNTSSKVHFGNGSNDDLKPFDYGLNFGAGFEVGKIQFSSQYYLGLKTLSALSPPLIEQKYKVLTISVAWLFGDDERVYRDYKSIYLRKHRQNAGARKKRY